MRTKLAATVLALTLGLGGLALAPAADAATERPEAAAAPATALFRADGNWQIRQSNGYAIWLSLTQDSTGRLYGTASASNGPGTIYSGQVDGYSITFVIGWTNGSLGSYSGSLNSIRQLTGTTYDINHPWSSASWSSDRTF
jgi:hypothetical protein